MSNICKVSTGIYSSLLNFQFRNCDVNFIYCRGDREAARSGLFSTCIYVFYVHDSFLYPFWWHSSEGCLLIWRLCWHHNPGLAATWRLSPRPSSSLRIRCDCSLPFPSIYKLSMSYTYTSSISGQLHVYGYIYLIHRWPCPYNVIMSFSSQLHYCGVKVLRVKIKFEIVQ